MKTRQDLPRQTQPLKKALPPARAQFAYDLALFASGFDRSTVDSLLEGLSHDNADKALQHASEMRNWDSGMRQGRLVLAFGPQPTFGARLQSLFKAIPESMAREVFNQLPVYGQTALNDFERWVPRPEDGLNPLKKAFASRLAHEALHQACVV